MRWSNHDCFWGRPLKSICCLLDGQILNFNYFHLNSSNITYVNGPFEDKEVKIKNFEEYLKVLGKNNIELDHEKREAKIRKSLNELLKKITVQLN